MVALTDQMVVSDAERLQQDGELRRFGVGVLDDQPVYVPDQHERLSQPGEVGHLFGPPVRGRDDVHGVRFGRTGTGTAAAEAEAKAVTADAAAAGAVHHVPGDLPGDAHQQVPRDARALVHHHLGHGHGHEVLGQRVGPGGRLALLRGPGAGSLVLQQHHEHGAHREHPQDAHLYGYGQHGGRRVPSIRQPSGQRSENTSFVIILTSRRDNDILY